MIRHRVAGAALLLTTLAAPRLTAQLPALVPLPSEVRPAAGAFVLPDTVTVTLAPTTPRMREIAAILAANLADAGIVARVRDGGASDGTIHLRSLASDGADESYRLEVTPISVQVTAPGEAG
ncbi:MAG: glycoside hydrolase family 20 zincin-like fold domain-containing protein, partial [Microbacteriaceae bacterium]